MKSKKADRKSHYTKMKHKLYTYVFIAVVAAIAFVVFLRQFVRGTAGDWIVDFLQNSFYLNERDALIVYQYTIRNNMDILIYATVALCFFFLCRILLANFMRYFDEVNAGIDSLIKSEGKQIELSEDMAFMEQKLNALKQTLEKREQDAKLAEQRKNDLVMYLAHDIRTPLTSVIGYLSLLNEAPDMPTEQKAKYLHIGLEKAYHLENLVNEFFEITRYNLQAIALYKKDIDLYYMLMQLVDEVFPQLSANNKKATIHAAEDLTIRGDSDKLARAFNNILKNAIAYSEDNSNIEITASVENNNVIIKFRNAGSIPKDKLLTIFEKFYRLNEARSSYTGGAGLGLAIAKEIIVLHGGSIKAESENDCTVFTVELPLNEIKEI